MSSPRNRTIRTPLEAGREYLARCLNLPETPLGPEDARDRIICGDLFAAAPKLPERSVDLLIADPPYNLTKSFNGSVFHCRDTAEYEAYTRTWLSAVRPLLKETASIYVCCDWTSSPAVARVLGEFFPVRNRITWQREKGRGAGANWKNSAEDIYFATAGKRYTFHLDAVKIRRRVVAPYREAGVPKDWRETAAGKFRDSCPGNFWDDITIPFWSMPENTGHPTQKPEKLLAKLILASSDPGDLVFDPFAGSGSTAVTAKKLHRRFLAVEIDPQYCVWAQQRLEQAELHPEIQGYRDGIFYERNSAPR
ncbi:MAG: site-specific DNA-methyltransferase [Lentisphaeria bacterium]|nr:site-specific DNA-methyltransferase [Lentisphaeria bacterium]